MKNKEIRNYTSPLLKSLLGKRDKSTSNKTKNRMRLAAKLDDLRKNRGWNKTQFAEAAKQNNSVITKWLSGTHHFTMDTISDLEILFGVKIFRFNEDEKIVFYKTIIINQELAEPKPKQRTSIGNKWNVQYRNAISEQPWELAKTNNYA